MIHPVFYELFEQLPRQGPGSDSVTRHVSSLLPSFADHPAIIDIGCGSGAQTQELARCSNGIIVAMDNHRPLLKKLQHTALQQGWENRVMPVQGDMFIPGFAPHSFDVIWSEGAIYNMGLEAGLATWKPLLKPSGVVVVSHISWLVPDPSEEIVRYWSEQGVENKTIEENAQAIEQAGYTCLHTFVLPEAAWMEFYNPMEEVIAQLRQIYHDDEEAQAILQNELHEMEIYRKYSSVYGYVFYVMQVE